MKRNKYSDWREDLREIVDVEPKTDKKSDKMIDTKQVKNKIVINPQMTEAFEQIGATILEIEEVESVDETHTNTVQNEGLSIDDQMKISQKYNRMSPEEKKAANKKAMGTIKKITRQKDTRTDAQKMTDATGPRPGSRYRGD